MQWILLCPITLQPKLLALIIFHAIKSHTSQHCKVMKSGLKLCAFVITFIRPEILELYLVSTDRTGNTCWNLVLHSNRLRFFRNVVAWCGAGVDCGNACPFHLELTSYASYITMHDCKPFSHVKHTLCVWTSSTATLVIINLHIEVSWENKKNDPIRYNSATLMWHRSLKSFLIEDYGPWYD